MNDYIPMHWTDTVSLIGAACRKVHELRVAGDNSPNWQYEQFITRSLKGDVFQGFGDDPVASLHLASRLKTLPAKNVTAGPLGEEIKYFSVRTFPSGSIVGCFGVWPGRGRDVYAIVVDEKFPEFFGLYFCLSEATDSAEVMLNGLEKHAHLRNAKLGNALVECGWYQLVPRQEACDEKANAINTVPVPSLELPLEPHRSASMSRENDLGRLVHDIGDMVRAAASHTPLQDDAVRRVLSFLSQVILVVEQAFQDVLTVLIEVQFLDDAAARDGRLNEIRRRVALLTALSHYRDAAEICSRLKHLRQNYDTFVRPTVETLPGFSDWQGVFGLIEEREGRIIQLVEWTAREVSKMLDEADTGNLANVRRHANEQAAELRHLLSELHTLNGRILGLSGEAGFLELTKDRNALEREVRIHVDQRDQSTTHGHRVTVGSGNTFSGDFVIANSIRDSFKRAAEAKSPDLREQLDLLCKQVEDMARKLLEKQAAEVSQDLSTFVTEAAKPEPRQKWYQLSADGLIEAAKACTGVASPMIATVKGILARLAT